MKSSVFKDRESEVCYDIFFQIEIGSTIPKGKGKGQPLDKWPEEERYQGQNARK